MQRGPIPRSLGSVFTTADAAAQGVSASRLRAQDLERPFRGLRTVPAAHDAAHDAARDAEESELDVLRERARDRAVLFSHLLRPHQFFSHATAAILWDLPLPISLLRPASAAAPARAMLLDVGVSGPLRQSRRSDVRPHRVAEHLAHVMEHPTLGVRLTTPASTWAMLGGLVGPYDLVALGDAVVREQMFRDDPPPLATLAQLQAAVDSGRRVGIDSLRLALPRVRTRSASRPETWTRLTLIDADLAEPELNWPVLGDTGELIAVVDLAYPECQVAIEYEGEHHLRNAAQWARDIERYERLAAAGWVVIRVTKTDLFRRPASVVDRVRRACG